MFLIFKKEKVSISENSYQHTRRKRKTSRSILSDQPARLL